MNTAADQSGRRYRGLWIMTSSLLGLMTFYYLARADTIGVSSAAGSWAPMTNAPLPAPAHFMAAALLLGVLPLASACIAVRKRPRQLGLRFGRWREGLVWVAIGVPLAIVAGRIAAANPVMRAVYPLYPGGLDQAPRFWTYAALQMLYYGAWEVLFRGVLLFGLEDVLGARGANLFQTALSVTAHFGRALPETLSALPAGLVFGSVALRTRSIGYVALIHWTVGISMDWFIVHGVWS